MTAPTSMPGRFGVRGGAAGRPIAVRGHSVAARSGDFSEAVAGETVTDGACFGFFVASFGWLTRSVRPKKFAM